MQCSKSSRVVGRTHLSLKRFLGWAAVCAVALCVTLAAGSSRAGTTTGDVIAGDGTSVEGTNIAELKAQIERDRLACAGGGDDVAGALAAVGALGAAAAWRRRPRSV